MHPLKQVIRRAFYYGTSFTEDIDTQERIKAVNFIILPSIPIIIVLAILNIINEKYFLASTNLVVFFIGVFTVLINPFKKYDTLKLLLNILLSANCTIQAICYHNGSEYFNIQNLVVILIFFNDRKFIIPSIFFSVVGFVFAKYMIFTHPPLIEAIPRGRIIFNITWFLGMMVFGMMYFKRNQLRIKLALREKNKQLTFANRTKEKIFSIIAHDLRSPIAQLKGTLELVNKKFISPEEFQGLSGNFYKQIDELQDNLNNLLSWSQSQLGGIKAKPQIFSLKVIASEAVGLIQQILDQKEITIVCASQPTMVYADPDHVRIVLRNLVSNAAKFSRRGSSIHLTSGVNENDVIVQIKDDGIGIDGNTLRNLFTEDQIVSTKGTENEKGTGLGLKLCKEFLEINNGTIAVESEVGKGSIFTITLPLAK